MALVGYGRQVDVSHDATPTVWLQFLVPATLQT